MTNIFIELLFLSFSTYHAGAEITNAVRGRTSDVVEDVNTLAPPPLEAIDSGGSLIASQFSNDPYQGQDKMELILSGKFILSDVHMARNGEVTQGHFCEFDFGRQQHDPSLAPRFVDLYGETRHCQEHHVAFDLHEVAQACRERDASLSSMHSIEPSTFIFHQPKSGSSLLTNMIAAGQPGTRVISEPVALSEIVGCQKCTHAHKVQALQDAIYLWARTTKEKEEHLFIKLTSASTIGLPIVLESFPDTKWIFVYRDADTILQKLMNSRVDRRTCSHKKRRNPGAAMTNFLLTQERSVANLETDEQICAAVLATSMATVQHELAIHNTSGRLVDYNELTSREGIQEIFQYLEVHVPDWNRIEEQRKKRANNGQGKEWEGEDDLNVSHEVKSATAEFKLNSH